MRAYRAAFAAHAPSRVAYSAKACALTGVLRALHPQWVSAASLGELSAAVRAGVPASRCWLHGNAKTQREIDAAVRLGATIVIDGEHEPERVARAANGRRRRVWLRVLPEVVADTHAHLRTSGEQKFGAPLTARRGRSLALDIARNRQLRLTGIHAHIGSQITDMDAFTRVARELASFARDLRADGVAVTEVCVGGGLAAPETGGDLDVGAYADAVAGTVHDLLPDANVVVEPGRSLVARAAVALYRVQDRKTTVSGRVFLAVDGGMGDNIRPSLYGARYEATLAEGLGRERERVTIAGAYCEAGDVLIDEASLPRAGVDDLVVVPSMGAYSLAMASNYNLRPRPAVVLVDRRRARLIRRRETERDLFRLERR